MKQKLLAAEARGDAGSSNGGSASSSAAVPPAARALILPLHAVSRFLLPPSIHQDTVPPGGAAAQASRCCSCAGLLTLPRLLASAVRAEPERAEEDRDMKVLLDLVRPLWMQAAVGAAARGSDSRYRGKTWRRLEVSGGAAHHLEGNGDFGVEGLLSQVEVRGEGQPVQPRLQRVACGRAGRSDRAHTFRDSAAALQATSRVYAICKSSHPAEAGPGCGRPCLSLRRPSAASSYPPLASAERPHTNPTFRRGCPYPRSQRLGRAQSDPEAFHQ